MGSENGRTYAFTSSFTEDIRAVINDDSFDLTPKDDDIDQLHAAHKYVNWLFARADRYALTVQVSAWTPGNTGATNAIAPARAYTVDVTDEASYLAESGSAPSIDQARPAPAPGTGGTVRTPNAPVPAPGATGTTDTISTTTGMDPAPPSGAHITSDTIGSERCVATRITHEITEAETVTLTSNSIPTNATRTALTTSVSDDASGNATDGHFNLGSAIENGTLITRVKDDRIQPVQWVNPLSLTFALGDAVRITTPTDLGFVATPSSSVWLVPSTQIMGVPWLGLNSQRKEIVTGIAGPAQFTLDAVEGPGHVAAFDAGVSGSGVGEHVFDDPGIGYTLDANTHAHQDWVFVVPGAYTLTIVMRVTPSGAALVGSGFGSGGDLTVTGATGPNGRPTVSQVVGRTASGRKCDLSLTITNADAIPSTVVPLTWASTNAAYVWVGAIGRRRNLCKAP